jgi:hypothetical protein
MGSTAAVAAAAKSARHHALEEHGEMDDTVAGTVGDN